MAGLIAVLALAALPLAAADAPRVVIVGFDGLSPAGIRQSKTPVFDQVRSEGAWTMHARGVMPTSSSSNWASMIMGAGPEQHGITSNEWMPDKFEIPPVVKGPGGIFPTVFGALREQRPGAVVAIFHDWKDYARLVEKGAADPVVNPKGPQATMAAAIEYLRGHSPDLLFIHLDHVDHAGHESGHGSPEYIASVEEADRLTGLLVAALKEKGIYDRTALLLTADHGGLGKKHGGNTMAELEIPWIIRGPGIARGKEIAAPVNTYDTAATVARILGIRAPEAWIARPVMEAFR